MKTIKAIQTVYGGHKFRSRLEARWAVFFDQLGVSYEYEPEGFELPEAGRYLPDFYLPTQRYWIEVKGTYPTDTERRKVALLSEFTQHMAVIFWGKVEVEPFYFYSPMDDRWREDTSWGGSVYCPTGWDTRFHLLGYSVWPIWGICDECGLAFIDSECRAPGIQRPCGHDGDGVNFQDNRVRQAYESAKSARFEHGERP